MSTENIVALFETEDDAIAAAKALVEAGIDAGEVSLFDKSRMKSESKAAHSSMKEHGLWHRLFGPTVQEHEAILYKETVEKGGAVLSARVPAARAEALLSVLDAFDPIDQTERSELILEQARANGHDEVVRLFEEKLNIAKRTVQRGTTRIRRYVVERPVEESVTLMEEHAEVLRRAVDDPSFVADVDWSEQTIEVAEMGEEAIVSKAARVAEEVVIRKTDSSRVERVQDTVRRQHVEVEHIAHDKDTAKA